MKLSKIASAVSFAHLLGMASAKAEDDEDKKDDDKAKRAEKDDDEDKQRADESDDDYAKRMEEKDDDEKAEEGDDEKDDKDEEGDAKGKKANKAKRAEDDSDDDGEEAKASAAERARCAKIIAHGVAHGCVRQAGVFAFDTNMSAAQAIKALEASAADSQSRPKAGLRDRMAGVRVPNVGADGGAGQALDPNDPKAKALAIVEAGKKRRGEV